MILGAAGEAEDRLAAALARVAQADGIPTLEMSGAEDLTFEELLCRCRGIDGRPARGLVVLHDVPANLRYARGSIPGRWRRLASILDGPAPRLIAVLADSAAGTAPDHVLARFRRLGLRVEYRRFGAGDRNDVGARDRSDAARVPRRPLSPLLTSILSRIPLPVRFSDLVAALGCPSDRLWREVAAAHSGEITVEGVYPDLRVHPLTRYRESASGGRTEAWSAPARTAGPEAEPCATDATRLESSRVLRDLAMGLRRSEHDDDRCSAEVIHDLLSGGTGVSVRRSLLAAGDGRRAAAVCTCIGRWGKADVDVTWDLVRALHLIGRDGEAASILDTLADGGRLERAEEAQLAARVLERAGRREDALRWLERASREGLGGDLEIERARIALAAGHAQLARDLVAGYRPTEGGDVLARASELVRVAGILGRLGEHGRSQTLLDRALAAARRLGPPGAPVIVNALSGLAGLSRVRGDLREAERVLRVGVRYARISGGESRQLRANLAAVQYRLGRTDDSLATYVALRAELATEPGHPLHPHVALGLGTILRERGELHRALREQLRAKRWARDGSHQAVWENVSANLGELYLLLGDPTSAYRHRLDLLRSARRVGDAGRVRRARVLLAVTLLRLGRARLTREQLARAAPPEGAEGGDPRVDSLWEATFAGLLEAVGDERDARPHWGRAYRWGVRSGRPHLIVRALLGLARGDHHAQRWGRARRLLAKADEWAARDSCPELQQVAVQLLHLQLDEPMASSEGEQRARGEWRPLVIHERAWALGLREEALASLVCADVRDGDALPTARRLDRLCRGFARRLDRVGLRALLERLPPTSIVDDLRRELLDDPGVSGETVPVRHSPRRTRGTLRRALAELVDQRAVTELRGRLTLEGRCYRFASLGPDGLEILPTPVGDPGTLPERSTWGRLRPRQGGRRCTLIVPLTVPPPIDAAVLELVLERESEPASSCALDLAAVERELECYLARWLRRRLEGRVRTLERRLDSERARGAAAAEERRREALETEALTRHLDRLELGERLSDENPWIACSESLRSITARLELYAGSDLPLLVCGESGVGKSLFLKMVREASGAAALPFVEENCSALPEPLLEAEIFGYEPGAFTGADQRHEGILGRCARGLLVFDHLDDMPPALQARLFRVLESRRFRPLGGEVEYEFEARVAATLGRAPEDALASGVLRPELYYRLQGLEIVIPPLRERQDDILPLVRECLARHVRRSGGRPPDLGPEVERALQEHPWPGNVRQLDNLTQRWVVEGLRLVTLDDLPRNAGTPPSADDGLSGYPSDWRAATVEFQRRFLRRELARRDGNLKRTARELGMSRRHLQTLVEKLGLRERGAHSSSHPPPSV